MNQDLLQWPIVILLIALAGAAVTYGWLKFIDLLLYLTRNVKPKRKPTTAPRIKA